MASRLSRSLWVGVAFAVGVAAVQRCVFDEVQAQVRAVGAAPAVDPPNGARIAPLRAQNVARGGAPPAPALPQPIRIKVWFPRESDGLSDAEKRKAEAAAEEAVRTMSAILSVNRTSGPLLLSRDVNKYCKFLWRNSSAVNYNRCGRANKNYRAETCLDVTIPDDHLAGCDVHPEADSPRGVPLRPAGAGLADADFLLYLHIKSTDKCRAQARVAAYAVHCRTGADGRPLAGLVVICRDRLSEDTYNHNRTVKLLLHELLHVLGFSKHLFPTWRDCPSSPPVACSPRRRVAHPDGSGQMRIYTRSVAAAMQQHLASADPELGGPLENLDVPPGGVSSHWEARVLQGSIMAAAPGDWTTVRIDPVTLAALQDTGWYRVDLSQAQSLVWGDGEGPMFGSLSTCKDNSSSFFCNDSGRGCHFLHLHKGECQTDPYLEGCRVYKPLQNGGECWKKENNRRPAEPDWTGEVYGSDSRCFVSNLTTQNGSSVEGRCYRHRCSGPNRYQIQVSGSDWLDCPSGNTIKIRGFRGLLFCPDRRLCVFPDITPPSDLISSLPASNSSDPLCTPTSAQAGTLGPPAEITVVTAMSFAAAAAACLLASACYRKCGTCSIRVHSAPEENPTHRV